MDGNEEKGGSSIHGVVEPQEIKVPSSKDHEKKELETSVKVELISTETEEGVQFWNLGGIGAILRFKI